MALNRPTLKEIHTRIVADMQARVTSGVKIPRFSLLGVLAAVFAGAIHLVYGFLAAIADQLFPDTATTVFLDRMANLYGLPRKAATFAEGSVQFTGLDGATIPAGTQVQNSEGFTYSTLAEATISGGLAAATVQADEAGSTPNTEETTLQLVAPVANVDTDVEATTPPNGGQDVEADSALRARLLQRLRNPPSSGTAADYERWALEVPGVGKAWTLSAEEYAGAGTVGVVIATSLLSVVDPAIKANVQAYINTVRPVGAQADVVDLAPQITVLDIKLSPNNQSTRDAVDKNLKDLFISETRPGGTMLLSHIRSAVAGSGVTDYEITDITVAGISIGVSNIETTGLQTAVYDHFNASDL